MANKKVDLGVIRRERDMLSLHIEKLLNKFNSRYGEVCIQQVSVDCDKIDTRTISEDVIKPHIKGPIRVNITLDLG